MSVCTGVRVTASGGLNERRLWCTVSLPPYFPGIHHENLVMFCTECDQISTTTSLLLWPTVFTGLHTRIHSASHCWLPWNDRGILISVVCDRTTSVCSSPLQHHIGHFLMSRCLFVYMHLFVCILALFCSCRWDETRVWTTATSPVVHPPHDMSMESHGGVILTGWNWRIRRQTCPSVTSSTTNLA
jgi:hypothetical protein